MWIEFPGEGKYLVSIVQPIRNGRLEDSEVWVYERLDMPYLDRNPHGEKKDKIGHVRFLGSVRLETAVIRDLPAIIKKIVSKEKP